MKKKFVVAIASGLAAATLLSSVADAAPAAKVKYAENYKTPGDTGDWTDVSTLSNVNGAVTAAGGSHFSYFGGTTLPNSGNRVAWPSHGYVAQLDVYVDPASMHVGEGFDLDVASSLKGGGYGRDYIFHVGMTESGQVRVSGSNNSTNADVDLSTLVGGSVLPTAGWYTFQHDFYAKNGTLAVDLNVINEDGVRVFSKTLNTVEDTIANAGGPRYMWFNFIDGPIRFDNQRLFIKN